MKKFTLILFVHLILNVSLFAQGKSAEKIYRQTNDAIVRIYTHHDDNSVHGQGSGVIIKEKGWIVTNYHVLGDASIIYAEHNGKYIQLDSILAMDPKKDILILQLKDYKNNDEPGLLRDESDIIEALKSLGYSQNEARDALKQVPSTTIGTNARIKEALKILSGHNS